MRLTTIASAIALITAGSLANAATEIENNDSVSTAQNIVLNGGNASINAAISSSNDVDYYSFYGKAGEVVRIDIDNGTGGNESVDTILTVVGPAPAYEVLRMVDDSDDIDAGSDSLEDARIDAFVLPTTGKYQIAVSRFATFIFKSSSGPVAIKYDPLAFLYGKVPSEKGDYTLVIGDDAPTVQQVAIDIKPGSGDYAPINLKSKGKIPVAIISSPLFEALNVDVNSLTFGANGDEESLVKCNYTGDDVNGDGHLDRICHFDNQLTGFDETSLEGVLRGTTLDGKPFEGRGFLKVVPKSK